MKFYETDLSLTIYVVLNGDNRLTKTIMVRDVHGSFVRGNSAALWMNGVLVYSIYILFLHEVLKIFYGALSLLQL